MDEKIYFSFILGLFSALFTALFMEKVKKDIELTSLIDIFKKDFNLCWEQIDSAKNIPANDVFFSTTYKYRGVSDVKITGAPDLSLPIHNTFLYETEGPRLTKHLGKAARDQFWKVHLLSRDVEAIRIKLLNSEIECENNDNEYRKVLSELVNKLYAELSIFDKLLTKSYPYLTGFKRHFQ